MVVLGGGLFLMSEVSLYTPNQPRFPRSGAGNLYPKPYCVKGSGLNTLNPIVLRVQVLEFGVQGLGFKIPLLLNLTEIPLLL